MSDCLKSRRVVCHTGVPAGANRAFSDYRAFDGASRAQHFRAQWRSDRKVCATSSIIKAVKERTTTSVTRLSPGRGGENYHDAACKEIGLDPGEVAMMGTAANMNYAAVVQSRDDATLVTAVVTAGVHGNATCAGDPASWRERRAVGRRLRWSAERSIPSFS